MTFPIHYKLKNAPCADVYSVHKINTVIQFLCKVPATVNVCKAVI